MDTSDIGTSTSSRGRGRRGAATPAEPGTTGIVVLGPRDSLVGTLTVEGDVRIEGTLEGEVAATGEVSVQSSGRARASIEARDIIINGTVDGSAVAKELVSIGDGAVVTGEVRSARLRVDEGASVNATITMSANGDAPPARRVHDEAGSDEDSVDVTGSAVSAESEQDAYAEVGAGSESEPNNSAGSESEEH